MCVRERETDRQTDRKTDRERARERERCFAEINVSQQFEQSAKSLK